VETWHVPVCLVSLIGVFYEILVWFQRNSARRDIGSVCVVNMAIDPHPSSFLSLSMGLSACHIFKTQCLQICALIQERALGYCVFTAHIVMT
jgi:hypothetical protein